MPGTKEWTSVAGVSILLCAALAVSGCRSGSVKSQAEIEQLLREEGLCPTSEYSEEVNSWGGFTTLTCDASMPIPVFLFPSAESRLDFVDRQCDDLTSAPTSPVATAENWIAVAYQGMTSARTIGAALGGDAYADWVELCQSR